MTIVKLYTLDRCPGCRKNFFLMFERPSTKCPHCGRRGLRAREVFVNADKITITMADYKRENP